MAIIPRQRKDGSTAYMVRYPDPVTGKDRSWGTYDRKSDALTRERQVRLMVQTGELPTAPAKLSVSQLVAEWHQTRRCGEESIKGDKWAVSRLVARYGDRAVRSISENDCQELVAQLRAEKLSICSTNHNIKAMRSVFALAADRGYVQRSPARNVRRMNDRQRAEEKVRVISPEEHARLVRAFDAYWQPLIRVWPFVGLRISEVFGLRWDDVDLKAGTMTVRRQAALTAAGEWRAPKTAAGYRTIPLTSNTVSILKAWKLACPASPFDLVFPAKNGGRMNPHNWRARYWNKAKETAKLPAIVPHDMRHTFVSTLIRAGADIKYIQTVAGHENAKTTMDTYGHLWADVRTDVLARAEEVFRNNGVTSEEKGLVSSS